VLGLAWWAWQLPLFIAYGDSFAHSLLLIVPQTILMTWLVNSTRGSMIIALLFHAGLVVALTPLYAGSYSLVEIVLTWLVAIAVIQHYGPRDLSTAIRVSLPPVISITRLLLIADTAPFGGDPHPARGEAIRFTPGVRPTSARFAAPCGSDRGKLAKGSAAHRAV
jgi:hypothetical protein